MKKQILCVLVFVFAAAGITFQAYAEEIDWDFRDVEKIEHGPGTPTEFVERQLTAPDPKDGGGSGRPDTPFSEYIFEPEGASMNVNLGVLEKLTDERKAADMTFVMEKSYRDKFAVVKRGDKEVGRYRISDLFRRSDSFEAEGRLCRIYAEEDERYVRLKISVITEDDAEIGARYDTDERYMYISATRPSQYDGQVTVALVRKDDPTSIGYIAQVDAKDGKVETAFKFTRDTDDYRVVVNDGNMQSICDDIEVFASGSKAEASLLLTEENGIASASLEANNAFWGATDVSYIILAFYSESGELIKCSIEKIRCRKLSAEIPKDTKYIKGFAIESYSTLVPQTAAVKLELGKK